jgi:hypothetical protein
MHNAVSLTKEPRQLKPSESVPVLQYGIGPARFIYQFLNYDLISLIKELSVMSSVVPRLVVCLPVVR